MTFHFIALHLPAGLDDASAGSLASGPCDLLEGTENAPLSGSAARQGDDHRNDWRLEWLFNDHPDLESFVPEINAMREAVAPHLPVFTAPDFLTGVLPDEDWLERCYQQFQPFEESGFYIYGSHNEVTVPDDLIGLQIDAATAFGSGEHGTTAGCLEILRDLKAEGFTPTNALDLGTGSGILAVAAHLLWSIPVLATDIDPESVRVSERHCGFNHVTGKVTNIVSDGFAAPQLTDGSRFDLTIANILAGPLKSMAMDIVRVTAPGGRVLLSGMLKDQAPEVQAVFEAHGCQPARLLLRGDWATLLLVKP